MNNKIRWQQYLEEIILARTELRRAIENLGADPDQERARGWLYKAFGITFDLSYKTAYHYLRSKKVKFPSKKIHKIIKICTKHQILDNGKLWKKAHKKRNGTTHEYEKHRSDWAIDFISDEFLEMVDALIEKLGSKLESKKEAGEEDGVIN